MEDDSDKPVKSRVEQIDALELDREVLHVLKNQLTSVVKFLPLHLQNKLQPEMDSLLQIIVMHLSLQSAGATFGQQLLNIKFAKSQRTKASIAVIIPILLKYLQTRASDIASNSGSSTMKLVVERFVHWGELSATVGSLLNLLLFLHSGFYPSILYRIFGIQMVYQSAKGRQRMVGYSHMTRELIWHGFIELLVFVLPLINYHYIKRQVLKILMFGASVSKSTPASLKKLSLTIHSLCPICSKRPILPHLMGCEHVFCYYCLQANILADPNFPCPQCGHRATGTSSVKKVCLTVM